MQNSTRRQVAPAEENRAGVVDTYTRLSANYEQTRLTPYMQLVEEIERGIIAEQANRLGDCTALEVGCGTGRFSEFLVRLGCHVHALDVTPAMLEQARALRSGASAIKWIRASAENLPLVDASFDLVLALKVLPHVPNLPSAIGDVARVLRPEGTAILEFYNPLSLGSLTRRYKVFTQWLTPARVQRLLEQAGLTTIERRGVRTVIPFGGLMSVPLVSSILGRIERALSRSRLCNLASYYIVVARPSSHPGGSRQ